MEFSFNTEVARITHCADEAAFVHRVWYLVFNNEVNDRNLHNGKYWTYDSLQALAKVFDFWTPRQLRRIIKNCIDLGLVETGQFSENPFDRRTWYTVTERVQSIYRKEQTHLTEPANGDGKTGESDLPEQADENCPNGQMIKGAIEDQVKDQIGDVSAPLKKSKRKQPERQRYGEFGNVLLSEEEVDKLCSRWAGEQVDRAIESLSAYMASKGKKYANHYATLLNWLKRDNPLNSSGKLIEEDWV